MTFQRRTILLACVLVHLLVTLAETKSLGESRSSKGNLGDKILKVCTVNFCRRKSTISVTLLFKNELQAVYFHLPIFELDLTLNDVIN